MTEQCSLLAGAAELRLLHLHQWFDEKWRRFFSVLWKSPHKVASVKNRTRRPLVTLSIGIAIVVVSISSPSFLWTLTEPHQNSVKQSALPPLVSHGASVQTGCCWSRSEMLLSMLNSCWWTQNYKNYNYKFILKIFFLLLAVVLFCSVLCLSSTSTRQFHAMPHLQSREYSLLDLDGT